MKGTLIHDITDYNRISKMFSMLQLHDKRLNHSIMSYGSTVESFHVWDVHVSDTAGNIKGAGKKGSMIVGFSLNLGIFDIEELLWLKYAPITLEFTLAGQDESVILGTF